MLCPLCCEALDEGEAPTSPAGVFFRSQATIPIIETRLYTCPSCGWWAVRESRADCELSDGVSDFLLLPGVKDEQGGLPLPPPDCRLSWQSALSDPPAWQVIEPLPKKLALILLSVSRME